jgi:hypothetical protein
MMEKKTYTLIDWHWLTLRFKRFKTQIDETLRDYYDETRRRVETERLDDQDASFGGYRTGGAQGYHR